MAVPKEENTDFHVGHRQRLRDKFVKGQLADYELLELMLTFAINRRDVRKPARALKEKFGSIYQIISAPLDELAAVKDVGMVSAICIKLMHRMMTIGFKEYLIKEPFYKNYGNFENYCRLVIGCKTEEEVRILFLNDRDCLLAEEVHSCGTSNKSAIYPEKIAGHAAAVGAKAVIMIHNHPTPLTSFSEADKKITQEVQRMLAVLGVVLRDHYVVSGSVVYSARNFHLLND